MIRRHVVWRHICMPNASVYSCLFCSGLRLPLKKMSCREYGRLPLITQECWKLKRFLLGRECLFLDVTIRVRIPSLYHLTTPTRKLTANPSPVIPLTEESPAAMQPHLQTGSSPSPSPAASSSPASSSSPLLQAITFTLVCLLRLHLEIRHTYEGCDSVTLGDPVLL